MKRHLIAVGLAIVAVLAVLLIAKGGPALFEPELPEVDPATTTIPYSELGAEPLDVDDLLALVEETGSVTVIPAQGAPHGR